VNEGGLDLEALAQAPFHEIMGELSKVKGIGPWTVEYMMCRGMGRYDALPANDAGLKAAVSRFYQTEGKPSEKTVRGILDRLGQYKGYVAFYLIFAYALEKYQFDPRVFRSQIADK
jgi:DNA-3-methyladenine glycosylase II